MLSSPRFVSCLALIEIHRNPSGLSEECEKGTAVDTAGRANLSALIANVTELSGCLIISAYHEQKLLGRGEKINDHRYGNE